MGRKRRESGFDVLVSVPWPIGVVAGLVLFSAIRWGVGLYFLTFGNSLLKPLGDNLLNDGTFSMLAWTALSICWLAAFVSYLQSRKRRNMLDRQTGLRTLLELSWREFEQLVGEAYRRLGYSVMETGQGGADGGVDLRLQRNGGIVLVQCKQWKSQQIGVTTIREMYGLLTHHHADEVKIVCVGRFTSEAEQFARGKPIELVDGVALERLVSGLQQSSVLRREPARHATGIQQEGREDALSTCPRCGHSMQRRKNRRDGTEFWGCQDYPACRGTRSI